MDQSLINRIVEAALLAANQPLALAQLHGLFPEEQPAPPGSVEQALEQLREACADRGVELVEVASGKVTRIDNEGFAHPVRVIYPEWSPDSRWLTYSRPTGDANNSLFLYDTRASKLTRATTGYLNDSQPTFDPDGKYLFYASDREFAPVYGSAVGVERAPNTFAYKADGKRLGEALAGASTLCIPHPPNAKRYACNACAPKSPLPTSWPSASR